MHQSEGSFDGPRGIPIAYRAWRPLAAPKAVLIVVHGLGEHISRYAATAERLVSCGYAVVGFDLPGHGRSGGRREHVERFADYTETLTAFRVQQVADAPESPHFLLGHSMGGLIVARALLDPIESVRGAILSAPAVGLEAAVPCATRLLASLVAAVAPGIGIYSVDPADLSRDPDVVAAYVADPLVHHGRTPARLMVAMLRASQQVSADAARIRLPLLVLTGGEDRIADPGAARRLIEHVGAQDRTLHVYDGLRHEILNEPERERVLTDLVTWLDARSAASRKDHT